MISKKRIRIMTRLADFEKRNYRALHDAEGYFRSDYIGVCLLKNLLRITAVYLVGLIFWACSNMDMLMKKLNTMELGGIARTLLVPYIILALMFLALTYVIASFRYYKAEKAQQTYRNMLDALLTEYEREDPEENRGDMQEISMRKKREKSGRYGA